MINAIGSALSGLNAASLRLNASAARIANVQTPSTQTTPKNAQTTGNQTSTTLISAQENAKTSTLAADIVEMKLASLSYKANLKTLDVAGEMFDALLDAFDD